MDINKEDRSLIINALCQLYYELGRQLDVIKGRAPIDTVRKLINEREKIDSLITRLPNCP